MFVVTLKFSKNKGRAREFMEGHNAWIKRGFDDGVFLLVGNLEPKLGGGIVAHDGGWHPTCWRVAGETRRR